MKWFVALFASTLIAAAPQPVPYDADLFKKDDQIYSGEIEFLYWKVAEGALDYALKMTHSAPATTYAQGRFHNATYQLDPGFRVGLLYFRAPHYWEVRWLYTRMTSRGENTVSEPSGATEYLTGTWPQLISGDVTQAKSNIHFNYNVVDMIVDRVFFPNPHLRMRVLGGAYGAWMNQNWYVRYFNVSRDSTTIQNQWRFGGAGLKTGLIVDWYWTWDLYMTAQSFLGALIGSYSNKAKQSLSTDPNNLYRDAHYSDIRGVATAQLILGPSWQKNFPKNRVELFAGFEANGLFNLQEVYRSTSGAANAAKETWMNTGFFVLYGLTTRLTVDF